MALFLTTVGKALKGYKALLRKNLTAKEYAAKLRSIGWNSADLKSGHEVKLYEVVKKIVLELEREPALLSRAYSVNFHYGEKQLLEHLKKILANYQVVQGKVVHLRQHSSCVLLTTIQMLGTAGNFWPEELTQKLYNCARVLVQYGTEEQKELFKKALVTSKTDQSRLVYRQLLELVTCAT